MAAAVLRLMKTKKGCRSTPFCLPKEKSYCLLILIVSVRLESEYFTR